MIAASFENVGKVYPTGLSRRRGTRAVANVSLQIPAGQVVALLGPNRAGKTTLARVGYMHENQHFPRYLTARELLRFYAALTLMRPEVIPARVDELLKLVGLADRTGEPIWRFSKGMVQ